MSNELFWPYRSSNSWEKGHFPWGQKSCAYGSLWPPQSALRQDARNRLWRKGLG